mmetsp:Transcript_13310/g.21823  ORF Transcript_13310/g.21823 Transcript_13310/m.21823 type:complete len:82 (-) Transcript_13310:448-693(-)
MMPDGSPTVQKKKEGLFDSRTRCKKKKKLVYRWCPHRHIVIPGRPDCTEEERSIRFQDHRFSDVKKKTNRCTVAALPPPTW